MRDRATCRDPAGRHTKLPAVATPSSSSIEPSSTKVCSISTCSCSGSSEPGAHLNSAVSSPVSSSFSSTFHSTPGYGVGSHSIALTST